MVKALSLLSACLLGWGLVRVEAATCASGMEAPPVVTLTYAQDYGMDAWIVQPDCSIEVPPVTVDGDESLLTLDFRNIDRVDGLIAGLQTLILRGNPLASGADFGKSMYSGTTVTMIYISGFSPALLDNVVYPESVIQIKLVGSAATSMSKVKFPSSLSSLDLSKNQLTGIDFIIPSSLHSLYLPGNPIQSLTRTTFPDSITAISLSGCEISEVRGVRWPRSLNSLDMSRNAITTFEIRRSDLPIFQKALVIQIEPGVSACDTSYGELVEVQSFTFCVISDERFDAQNAAPIVEKTTSPLTVEPSGIPSPASTGPLPGAAVVDTSSGSTSGLPIGESTDSTDPTITASSTLTNGSVINGQPPTATLDAASNTSTSGTAASSRKPKASASTSDPGGVSSDSGPASSSSFSSSSSNATAIISVIAGTIVASLIATFIYRRRSPDSTSGGSKYSQLESPTTVGGPSGGGSSEQYLANDVRNDKALIPFRIDQSELQMGQQLARGGFGVIYRAVFRTRDVAVKQMMPGGWNNEGHLASFMDEIRLCAKLDHPKIVAFVGIAWHTLRELSVVIELMAGGDLHSLLQRQPEPQSPEDWKTLWTVDKIKSKASIARDVAEAVEYLHAFFQPIIHRDLKARNVLLDMDGNAKLSDFGISREIPLDETMTGEIGTAAWIAPEVLRGERYSEKADIYSLGVLLVELDRCRHPYEQETSGLAPTLRQASGTAVNGMQVALLVSTGQLRPSVSSTCPTDVKALVDKGYLFFGSDTERIRSWNRSEFFAVPL